MKVEYKDGVVVITIQAGADEIANAPKSKTGKSKMVATTNGFSQIDGGPDGLRLSLNLIAK